MLSVLGMTAMLSVSTAELRAEFPVTPRDAGVVRDAITRWSQKVKSSAAMNDRIPIVFYLSTERCVVLQLRASAIGGSPVYCYEKDRDVLREEQADVE